MQPSTLASRSRGGMLADSTRIGSTGGAAMTRLSQKTAIVTGGGRGIGRGIALELARAGADVILADVDLENSERATKEIEELGRQALVTRVDVADARSVKEGVDQALAHFGRIEILVNNAGVVQDHIGAAITEDDFDRCYQVNLKECPLQREQTPEDIGHAVVFLVSEQARNITGQALNVDGGIQMS